MHIKDTILKNEKESNKVRSKKIGGELMKLSKYKKVSKISDDIYAVCVLIATLICA